ncbi:PQQ-binding-like beta-propeller repeat protein [Iodidimonas sp. SYSU 1G8]|uniref:outer membrane protein assembly factor BamB family protein n=1 Tax=Iodidimonas sp. SYSU 1G8 TaxID=3133967 RepID=UPI0031FE86F8
MSITRREPVSAKRIGVATVSAIALLAFLTACGNKEKKVILEGERKPIVELNDELAIDEALKAVDIRLPAPYQNPDWPQSGGYANHAMHHLQLGASPRIVWRARVDGSTSNRNLVAQPVVAQGMVFAMGSGWEVSAFDAQSGREVWSVNLRQKERKRDKADAAAGGGIAFDNGKLYVALGTGAAIALDPRTGGELWRTQFDVALRGSPTASEGIAFFTTHDNQLYALNANDGSILWQHVAIAEAAGLIGAASPAVIGGTVVAAFSSGELFALQASNGRVAWADSLTRVGRMTALSTLNDIDGSPVIDRGVVYAVGHSGRMAAIDLKTGSRLWENNVASAQTIWVAGDYLYVVTADNQLMALSRRNGRAKWISDLQRHKANNRKKAPIIWTGPVLAGDRLLVVTNNGMAASFSPYTGEFLGAIDIPSKRNYVSPVVANGTLYLLGDDGELVAMR